MTKLKMNSFEEDVDLWISDVKTGKATIETVKKNALNLSGFWSQYGQSIFQEAYKRLQEKTEAK